MQRSNNTSFTLFSSQKNGNPEIAHVKETFLKLGNNYWKQIIDGEFHQYGPLVFDEGLHNGEKEPGFYTAMQRGFDYAYEHMSQKLTISFYKNLHAILSSHLKIYNNINPHDELAENPNKFRNGSVYSGLNIKYDCGGEMLRHYFYIEVYKRRISENDKFTVTEKDKKYNQEIEEWIFELLHNAPKKLTWSINLKTELQQSESPSLLIEREYKRSTYAVAKLNTEWENKVRDVNKYLSNIAEELAVEQFASLSKLNHIITINYHICWEGKINKFVEKIFARYNNKIEELNKKSNEGIDTLQEKITAVAEIYQLLEWLHPFDDGQGRTDLVLLSKLLCDIGAHPAILEKPYFSSNATLEEWNEYLLAGMKYWSTELLKMDNGSQASMQPTILNKS